jgi:N-acetylglucosaminyldiphosphoundecaprenol N-acetyl-beta-D-mannosaminyltransferase
MFDVPMMPESDVARFNVLGVGVSALTLEAARDRIVGVRGRDRQGYVCVTGVHGVMEARDDAGFRAVLNGAWLNTPDGMPLVWLGRTRGLRLSRVYGPDLMLAVCEAGQPVGLRHYFYGGAPGVVAQLRARLTARFPQVNVVGTFTPPFRPLDAHELAVLRADVMRTRPDVLWVGLSTPKQERFMAQHWQGLDAGVLIGVGAAFDFHSGRIRQAPRWIQRSGFEWLFRMTKEPRRLAPRYLRNNPRFLALALAQALRVRQYPLE